VPELLPLVLTLAIFGIGTVVLTLATAGYVGFGLRPPTAELGLMMGEVFPYCVRADTGQPFAPDAYWFTRVASRFVGEHVTLSGVRHLTEYDDYYSARNNRSLPLPAYRATADNADRTLMSFSPATGEIVTRANREFRVRRWLVIGPQTWDWPFLFRRPLLWNAVAVVLLTGGCCLTLSGLYLGVQALAGMMGRPRHDRE
jgi:hypothetical protein